MTNWTPLDPQATEVRETTPTEKLDQDAASLAEATNSLAKSTARLIEARRALADAEGLFAGSWDAFSVRNRIHQELMEELRTTPDNLTSMPKSVR